MDISTLIDNTPDAILKQLAQRVKKRRLELNLTQKAFAKQSGVGYDAYRRFENSGEITLRNLLKCAITLEATEEFYTLFTKKTYSSIDEILAGSRSKQRQRASNK
ncbi:MAG: helix-turn-helix transcriptional regulator [Bacteroidales bacterium]|nr:helix-turn-helix transcriptional regulator [Bacteroidales bacterium]